MTSVAEERDAYRAGFERFAARRAASDPAWLRERRTAAMARFVDRGFPGPRDEAWRHTPTAPLSRGGFETAPAGVRVGEEALAGLAVEGSGIRLVFVNGRLSRELSRTFPDKGGVEVTSLRALLAERPDLAEPHLGRIAAGETGVFADLNTAFAEDGAVVFVAPGAVLPEPIHVVHLSAVDGAPTASYARTLVVAGRGSECRVVETFGGPEGRPYLANAVTEVVVGDNASVACYRLQRQGGEALHLSTLAVRMGRDARFADHSVGLGASLSRNDIDVRFEAEGGECVLNGLFVVDGRRVADTHSRIDHVKPHCSSGELYKGILDGAARGVFNGLVVVRPGAQKTDAWQMNRNVLLSREALVHSTPQLEILADDVKCRHGSTTGQLDPNALFYLRSRGIDEAAARSLLTWAFASDLVRRIEVEPLRRAVERHLQSRLGGGPDLAEVRP
jgi:Fe-S cluster assembly protein SufD